jgi:dTDP-glucose 4,6-dehydratase
VSEPQIILVTGGAGFIGSALVRLLMAESLHQVHVIDKLTYAGNLSSLNTFVSNPRFGFSQIDICDYAAVSEVFKKIKPEIIVHLAAETHVDRSIVEPRKFIETNIVGTYTMLQIAREFYEEMPPSRKEYFRFHHVSTDEVFGSLGEQGLFSEDAPYKPRSPYSASKASSDHLVRAWWHTYGLPVTVSHCSNNYGPYQFPEKLVPSTIIKALNGEPLPVYGQGKNIRDWLFVDDHVRAIRRIFENAAVGTTYSIGGHAEKTNIDVVKDIANILDRLRPKKNARSYVDQISFVPDRLGHDFRYAIDCAKIERELGWRPNGSFTDGLEKTVSWYLENEIWWQAILHSDNSPILSNLEKK